MIRPKLLDLFCGAGGCSMGYYRAGFDVVGVDLKEQPRYPFQFYQMDALQFLQGFGPLYDAIHASPPCQRYTRVNAVAKLHPDRYPDLVEPVRKVLEWLGKPWIMENVPGAPMNRAVTLCGSAFGLLVRRHRLFESSHFLFGTECRHWEQDRHGARFPKAFQNRGQPGKLSTVVQVYGHTAGRKLWPEAMGIDWMKPYELAQAIPPAYTEYLGKQLLNVL